MITQFDVLNKMPKETVDIFMNAVGGKQIGKAKDNKAVIEMFVDNDTFQNFAYQATYGEGKGGKSKRYFILYSIDAEEYEKQYALLKEQRNSNENTVSVLKEFAENREQ